MYRGPLGDSVRQSSHGGRIGVQASPGIEIAAEGHKKSWRLNRGRGSECFLVSTAPGAVKPSLAVAIGPREVQHADLEAGNAMPCCLLFHGGRSELYVAVGPWVVAVPLPGRRAGKPGGRPLLSFRGGSGQRPVLIHPSSLAGCGGEPYLLIRVARPLDHPADRP